MVSLRSPFAEVTSCLGLACSAFPGVTASAQSTPSKAEMRHFSTSPQGCCAPPSLRHLRGTLLCLIPDAHILQGLSL